MGPKPPKRRKNQQMRPWRKSAYSNGIIKLIKQFGADYVMRIVAKHIDKLTWLTIRDMVDDMMSDKYLPGVTYRKDRHKYMARIKLGRNKYKSIGCFDTEIDAYNAIQNHKSDDIDSNGK